MMLNDINSPKDIKKLTIAQLEQLCSEIRVKLIDTVAENGGHFASNLGVVELTTALHFVFDIPKDTLIFDVGHQCYTHKLLTGRNKEFSTLRKTGGISGFTRPTESEFDTFIAGHSSTSLSSAIGIARAKQLSGDNSKVIALIGDGAFTNGMVYEAINNIDKSLKNLIVILNDNTMSISKNVGSISRYLFKLRTGSKYSGIKRFIEKKLESIPKIGESLTFNLKKYKQNLRRAVYHGELFEELGFNYFGTVDGHNLSELRRILINAKDSIDGPLLIHVVTQKGQGYAYAEQNPGAYHGVGNFDIEFGNPDIIETDCFSNVFGKKLVEISKENQKICAITAAMKYATGLGFFYKTFKPRFFDVGICEGHAITFAGGLAKGGYKPVFAVYSTFLQRGYDQLFHDIILDDIDFLVCVDRAGIVGDDGETHQGIFDAAFLSQLGFYLVSPSNYDELEYWLEKLCKMNVPRAIRYPRGTEDFKICEYKATGENFDLIKDDKKSDSLIITYGRSFAEAVKAKEMLKQQAKIVDILKLNVISPIDLKTIEIIKQYKQVYFFEEGIKSGGIGMQFMSLLGEFDGKFDLVAIEDVSVKQASVAETLDNLGLSAKAMVKKIAGKS